MRLRHTMHECLMMSILPFTSHCSSLNNSKDNQQHNLFWTVHTNLLSNLWRGETGTFDNFCCFPLLEQASNGVEGHRYERASAEAWLTLAMMNNVNFATNHCGIMTCRLLGHGDSADHHRHVINMAPTLGHWNAGPWPWNVCSFHSNEIGRSEYRKVSKGCYCVLT